jgi:hypothetical protein
VPPASLVYCGVDRELAIAALFLVVRLVGSFLIFRKLGRAYKASADQGRRHLLDKLASPPYAIGLALVTAAVIAGLPQGAEIGGRVALAALTLSAMLDVRRARHPSG